MELLLAGGSIAGGGGSRAGSGGQVGSASLARHRGVRPDQLFASLAPGPAGVQRQYHLRHQLHLDRDGLNGPAGARTARRLRLEVSQRRPLPGPVYQHGGDAPRSRSMNTVVHTSAARGLGLRARAFTIAEIMTAMAIFSMVMVAVVYCHLFGLRLFNISATRLS